MLNINHCLNGEGFDDVTYDNLYEIANETCCFEKTYMKMRTSKHCKISMNLFEISH